MSDTEGPPTEEDAKYEGANDAACTAMGLDYMRRYMPPVDEGPPPEPTPPETAAKALEVGRWLELRYMTPEQIAEKYPDGMPPDPTQDIHPNADGSPEPPTAAAPEPTPPVEPPPTPEPAPEPAPATTPG